MLGELYKVVPKELLSIFDEEEMEMILYGVPFIDVNEWKEYSDYGGEYNANHKV